MHGPMLDPKLVELVAEVLDMPPGQLGPDDGIARTDGWNSLAQLNIVVAVEEVFDIRLPSSRLPQLTSMAAIQAELVRQGAVS